MQAVEAEFGGDAGENGDKCAGGTGNLYARAAGHGHNHAGHDGGINPLFRFHAGGDSKSHGKRQRHHAYNNAGHNIVHPMGTAKQTGAAGFYPSNHV